MKFWLIILGILGVLGILGFVILANLHSNEGLSSDQKEKALENLLGRSPRLTTEPMEWAVHKGKVLTLQYPKGANIYSPAKQSVNVIDSFSYSLPEEHILVTAQAKKEDIQSLNEDGSVNLRINSSEYNIESSSPVPLCKHFTKTGEDEEESLFCLENGELISLVITGTNINNVHKYYSIIFPSFQW